MINRCRQKVMRPVPRRLDAHREAVGGFNPIRLRVKDIPSDAPSVPVAMFFEGRQVIVGTLYYPERKIDNHGTPFTSGAFVEDKSWERNVGDAESVRHTRFCTSQAALYGRLSPLLVPLWPDRGES